MWKQLSIVAAVSVLSLFVFWLPFFARAHTFWGIDFGGHGTETIVQNFDGLNYLAVAKTLYDPTLLDQQFAGFGNPPIYYAAHFPLYPLLIRALDTIVTGPQALLLSIVISNALLGAGLYIFFTTFVKDKKLVTALSILALFFPARMISVRAVGSSEPLFMFFVLTSLAMAYKGKHMWGAILGSLAVLTRSPGIFLFGAYGLSALASYTTDIKKIISVLWPYFLMPLSLALLFGVYGLQFGNFWAYFNSSSELHPVFFPPFLIFSNTALWISDMWREDILYMYLLYGTGIALYIKRIGLQCGFEKLSAVGYGIFYGLILLLISHRDLARYALPIAPIALIGFAPLLSHKPVKWLLLLLVPIYLLGWQFVVGNVQPVSDWTNLL
jgi:hypothetical protein